MGSAHKHRSYIPQALQLPSMRRESSDDGGPHSRLFVLSACPRLFEYARESPTARLVLPKEILRYVRLSTPMFSSVTLNACQVAISQWLHETRVCIQHLFTTFAAFTSGPKSQTRLFQIVSPEKLPARGKRRRIDYGVLGIYIEGYARIFPGFGLAADSVQSRDEKVCRHRCPDVLRDHLGRFSRA